MFGLPQKKHHWLDYFEAFFSSSKKEEEEEEFVSTRPVGFAAGKTYL